ncbi:MAG TPA: HEPN domain-containing protein [Kofleriaceae bacterium]|jgi:uncharacterized protein (UPF0332 family)
MELVDKAEENLEAAERLLGDGTDPLNNAAASRAYYAAYQAVCDCAFRSGRTPSREYFRHDELPRDAVVWRILDRERGRKMRVLMATRVKADYWKEAVDYAEAAGALEAATDIVSHCRNAS